MEKINYKFLNYKHYSKFLEDLNTDVSEQRPYGNIREDAIVFIQDNLRIWARGQEYICGGSYTSAVDNANGLTVRDSLNNLLFKISPGLSGIQFEDGNGNILTYAWDVVIDDSLDSNSTNPIQNKTVTTALNSYTLKREFNEYKEWAEDKYGKIKDVIILPVLQIDVDLELNDSSDNPVANRIINTALESKANKKWVTDNYATKTELGNKANSSDLNGYVTTNTYEQGLATKQDTLIPDGTTISIVNNVISAIIDNEVFVIVSSLQDISDPSPNKIYIVETVQNEETVYIEWRYKDGQWVEIGQKDIATKLEPYLAKTEAASTYLTKIDASNTYQLKGDYVTRTEALTQNTSIIDRIDGLEDSLDNYTTGTQLEAFRTYVSNIYQRKGNYVIAEDVSRALDILQEIIDRKYVLKKDVYKPGRPSGWSTEEPTTINIQGSTGGNSSGGVGVLSNMVTLTTERYLMLVDNNLVDPNTYYFTYEGEETTNNWVFGDNFPVILTGEWAFGGTFPVILN